MWPPFCVRRWPRLCVHVTVGWLVCTCDRRFACAGDRMARKRSLRVHVTWISVRGWPLDPAGAPTHLKLSFQSPNELFASIWGYLCSSWGSTRRHVSTTMSLHSSWLLRCIAAEPHWVSLFSCRGACDQFRHQRNAQANLLVPWVTLETVATQLWLQQRIMLWRHMRSSYARPRVAYMFHMLSLGPSCVEYLLSPVRKSHVLSVLHGSLTHWYCAGSSAKHAERKPEWRWRRCLNTWWQCPPPRHFLHRPLLHCLPLHHHSLFSARKDGAPRASPFLLVTSWKSGSQWNRLHHLDRHCRS